MKLTTDNYYSREADIAYMSCSQFQAFEKCEAATVAKLRGAYTPEDESDALTHGRYFHAALEGEEAFDAYLSENFNDVFKTKTTKARGVEIVGKYAPYVKLDEMLEALRNDPVIKRFIDLPGESEKILTGKIGGVPWRIRVDKYVPNQRYVIDYKSAANLWELYYNPQTRERQSFIEEYGYMMRAAVYGEIERQSAGAEINPTFLIIAASKQDPPDKDIFYLNDDERWELELERVLERLPYIQRLKNGSENPRRCGNCEYCRRTKVITRIKRYTDLMPQFRNDPDTVEYDDYGGTTIS